VPDWKDPDKFFTKFVKKAIDEFAFNLTRSFLSDEGGIDTLENFEKQFSVLPGMVKTIEVYHQAAHTDFDNWGLIVHKPLSLKGMMLIQWDENTSGLMRGALTP
jgi:hypothetical protein